MHQLTPTCLLDQLIEDSGRIGFKTTSDVSALQRKQTLPRMTSEECWTGITETAL
jgi:hypothetical protein